MYDLEIVAPFHIVIGEKTHSFQYLIRGYGARLGMVIDKAWSKIEAVDAELMERGYGYSCFDIEADINASSFSEILEDWGKSDA